MQVDDVAGAVGGRHLETGGAVGQRQREREGPVCVARALAVCVPATAATAAPGSVVPASASGLAATTEPLRTPRRVMVGATVSTVKRQLFERLGRSTSEVRAATVTVWSPCASRPLAK